MNEQPKSPHEAGHQPPQSPRDQSLAGQAGERIQAIIEAAERAAAAIIEDAKAQARKQLDESRSEANRATARRAQEISLLTSDLIDRTEAVRRQSDELLRLLDETKRRLDAAGQGGTGHAERAPVQQMPLGQTPAQQTPMGQTMQSTPAEPPAAQHLRAVEAQPHHEGRGGHSIDGPRLLATQMAVGGSSRAEIERRLRNEFEIEDTGPMLDAILGQEE